MSSDVLIFIHSSSMCRALLSHFEPIELPRFSLAAGQRIQKKFGLLRVRGRLSGCRTTMQVSRSMVAFSKFGACCCRGSAASPCARIKPHELTVTARCPPGPVGVVAGLLGVSNYGTRPFVAQERGKNHQLQHWLPSSPNISFQATLRKKPRKAPELHRYAKGCARSVCSG